MYDFHVHTHFSLDSKATMKDMAEAACQIGLKGLCFTDHHDIDYPIEGEENFEFRYGDYMDGISRLRKDYGSKLEIFSGIELGLQPCVVEKNREFLQGKEFDFVMGSVHAVKRKEMHSRQFVEGVSDHQAVLDYFEDTMYCLKHFRNFDVLGHLDGFRRYLSDRVNGFRFGEYRELIEAVLTQLIEDGKGIEVNTSGVRYGLGAVHPMGEILRTYKELGGEILTVGSDSHRPKDVGFGFGEVFEMLGELGFGYYCVFRGRKAEFLKIR